MTDNVSRRRRFLHAWVTLALAVALGVGLPVGVAPRAAGAPAGSAMPSDTPGSTRHAGTSGVHGAADTPGPAEDASLPSIHYEDALAHAADDLEFEPGDRVDVPFSPRRDDTWDVDGQAPRALPAGHASGAEIRAAGPKATWAKGAPKDLAGDTVETSIEPASFSGSTTDEVSTAALVGTNGLRREVFGFLPYWEIGDASTTLDWRTLSTVAYFSVGCLGDGHLDKLNANGTYNAQWAGWTSSKMTSIINAAHNNHTRVVLTISCFAWSSSAASRQASLLRSSTARATLARVAAAAVRDRGVDGINLDFEPIVAGYAEEFTALVRSVRSELNKIAPGYQLTFDTLGSIGNQPIAAATASGGADAVFIMGYDYRTASSSVAGSISPLAGPRYDLNDTVKAYLAKIPASKIILGVPYYGRAWSTSSDAKNATTLNPAKYGASAAPPYAQAVQFAIDHGRRYDSVEQAPWTAYRKQTCTSAYGCVTAWRELYYDDAASLRLRYDLVNRTSLRGAGIWALGYDGTRPELRAALAEKFLTDRTAPIVGITTLASTQRDEGFRVSWTSWDDSTIEGYDVQVATDGGAWTSWLTNTDALSSIFLGHDGHAYAFRVRATDSHGNVTAWNSATLAGAIDPPASIAVGTFATVLADGLRMRAGSSTGADIMVTLADGDALRVIGGPVAGEGYTWWQVSGPVRQWSPVDSMQVGGWIAASGNGVTNAGPRRPVYATRVDAAITDLQLNGGGQRVLSPNGDGQYDELRVSWRNHRTFDSLSLRVFREDGTVAGSVALGGTDSGAHAYDWNGRLDGVKVPPGIYVIQLRGTDGGATFHAPSGAPVNAAQARMTGLIVGDATPTAPQAFSRPATPTSATSLTWSVTFGGPISGLTKADFARSGTATGCVIGNPTGSGARWAVTLTGCSSGTVILGLKASTVGDAVGNVGPPTQANAQPVLIDRSDPKAKAPRVSLREGVTLPSTSTKTGVLAMLTLSATDIGGAGVRSFDVMRSTDGGAYASLAKYLVATSLPVTLIPGHSYAFKVRARDNAGNLGAWVAGPAVRAYLPQQGYGGITWKGSWTTAAGASCSGGSVRSSTTATSSARYTFSGRAIAWVSTLGPGYGSARVYIDGTLVTTINLAATAPAYRRVVFARSWATSGTHTIRIVIPGAGPRVDVDAFEVLR